MEITWTDITGVIISGLIWITAVVAIVVGCVYFNRRLKFYIYQKNDILCLSSFDRGNGACHISIAFYALKKISREQMTEIEPINGDELKVDVRPFGDFKKVYFIIIDNFGRKYKTSYKRSSKDERQ